MPDPDTASPGSAGTGGTGGTPAVELRDVVFRYDDEPALSGVTFQVEAGSFAALIGPNGSGKTTLLRILLGLLRPETGEARIFGEAPGRHGTPVGYVPQRASIPAGFPLTVREVVVMGRYGRIGWLRRPGSTDREEAERALDRVGLAHLAGRSFSELSGGQQQRALIARSLAADPALLLLDEPTAGLDPAARAGFYHLLCELQRRTGLTVLTASHDIEVVAEHADAVILLDRRVVAAGSPGEILTGSTLAEAYRFPPAHHHRHGGHATPPGAGSPGDGRRGSP